MANALYPKFKEALLAADVDLADGQVSAILVDTGTYAYSASHDALNDIPAGARIGTPQVLAGKTITDGVFNAADIVFPNVPLGGAAEALVIFVAAGTEAGSRLVAFFDTAEGLPVTPNGGDINITWGINIFSL